MMGAKNHAVVLPDAHREQSINALVGAGFGAAGQRCMATSVVVLVGKARDWLPGSSKAKALKVNAGAEAGTDVGPVVSKAAKERILSLIDEGVKAGAKLELDGRNVKVPGYEQGNFVGPTIFSGVTTDMSIYTEEIFGPVVVVLEADTLDEAIALVNRNPMGNGVGLFTQSAAARKFQSEIDIGRSASTSRSRCRCPTSASPARAARSSAISARTASRSCSSIRRRRRSPRAGSTTTRRPAA